MIHARKTAGEWEPKIVKRVREVTRLGGSNVSAARTAKYGIGSFLYRSRHCRGMEHREHPVADCPDSDVVDIRYDNLHTFERCSPVAAGGSKRNDSNIRVLNFRSRFR